MTHPGSRINAAGFLSTLLYFILGSMAESSAGISIGSFLLIMISLSLVSFLLFYTFSRHPELVDNLSVGDTRLLIRLIIVWAVVFRLTGLLFSPIYEDDYFRYLWDGFLFSHTGTPYGVAPSSYFGDSSIPASFQAVLDGINYPDIPTIYGPTLQYSFLLGYWLSPGDVFGLQLIYSIADVLLIVLLARVCSLRALILYAWCPLVIKEIAFTAHPDGLGVLLLIGCFVALKQSLRSAAVILLALSVCAKIFAVLFVPLVLIKCKPRHCLLFLAVVILLYVPFIRENSSDLAGLFAFANDWQFNGSFYPLLLHWLSGYAIPAEFIKWACAILFGVFYTAYMWHFYRNKEAVIPRGDWIMGAFFLVAPVVNAWYLLWLLAFATMFPTRWAWTASVAVLLSYITGVSVDDGSLELYQQPIWARLLEYGVIAIALSFDIRSYKKFKEG